MLFMIGVVFLAALVQGLLGFGSAMVAMSLLPDAIGLVTAAPLVAVLALPSEGLMLVRYRGALNWRAAAWLGGGMLAGVPVGMLLLRRVGEGVLLPVLGAVIVVYAVYALADWHLPQLRGLGWALLAGWFGGVLGGAYNTSGPPVVVYGNCRRWLPAEFKGSLQAFFLLCDVTVVAGHALSGNLTPVVWGHLSTALPAVVAGVGVGMAMDRIVPPRLFRRLVLAGLVVLGARLVLTGLQR